MARLRWSAKSIVRVARSNCLRSLPSTPPNLPNSVFTARSTFHTSVARFSMASVWKPTRRLLSRAASVVGPATITRAWFCSSAARPGMRSTSAYSPSVGRNITAMSVVYGGATYFW